jgi:ethanolamine utilization protein EutQ (cupin superfamily)
MTEMLHLKGEEMRFSQMHSPPGYASIARLIGPEISKTLGAGIATYNGCSFEWTLEYDEVIVVLEGIFRIRVGDACDRVIEAKPGDVIWLPEKTRLKYEGDKAKIFYATYPVDWRSRRAA